MSQTSTRSASREPVSKQRLRLWIRLLTASRFIEHNVRDKLRTDFETTLPRFDVLAALYRNAKGLKMSEVSAALKVSNGNITGIVDRLVEDGLIIRVAVPGDRRAHLVRLTKRGTSEFEEMAAANETWINDILSGLTGAECTAMIELLARVERQTGSAAADLKIVAEQEKDG